LTIFLPNADEEFKEEERRENLPATLLLLVLLLPRRSVVFVVKVSRRVRRPRGKAFVVDGENNRTILR